MRHAFALALIPLALAGCGWFGDDEEEQQPPPPTIVRVTLTAGPDVNPDPDGRPSPIAVRVFRMEGTTAFTEVDFFTLDDDPDDALGDELSEEVDAVLMPGGVKAYEWELEEEERFVGVAAAYRDIENADWKAFVEVPRDRTTTLSAYLGSSAVRLVAAEF